ncbi:DNA ligase [Vibrio gallicus]|uniref:DNA ligase n=1 Tax=Vibrio gallicus TaxID=190897 RepID=UPI0021C40668|nr:DNA ligase [Vibrio gallicus]
MNHIKPLAALMCIVPSIEAKSEAKAVQLNAIPLANNYAGQLLDSSYLISEKLDGVRAIWDGARLYSRSGRVINIPEFFVKQMPPFAVEGELWAGHGRFHHVQQTVLDKVPNEASWRTITYCMFDVLNTVIKFRDNYTQLLAWQNHNPSHNVCVVKQVPFESNEQLSRQLQAVLVSGGEGLIIRKGSAISVAGRSNNILKLKPFMDAEALVVGYKPGKGKYQGMIGALRVQTPTGVEFFIGSGLSDVDRATPPKLGSTITYRFSGETHLGVPRFPRFVRVRQMQ